jgi:small-conductance mechanosensitive channel
VNTLSIAAFLPNIVDLLGAGTRRILFYSIFKIGALAITPVFLIKAMVFLVALIAVSNLLQRLLVSRVLKHLHVADSLKFALGRFATYATFLGGLFIGLQSLGVNLDSLVVFGGAVGVGVGLGLQNVVANFVAGIILLVEQPIRIGDRVEIKDTLGDVIRIAARSTWVRTNDNVIIIVPNSDFINEAVTNWTANDAQIRVNLEVGVGYSSDPAKVREVLLAAAHQHAEVLADPAPDVIFTGYGDNSLNFQLRVWTEGRSHTPLLLKSDLYFALFQRFAEAKIELPFPQRDLHLRSSDVPLEVTVRQDTEPK